MDMAIARWVQVANGMPTGVDRLRIAGTDGRSYAQIDALLEAGWRFVFFEYCISCLAFTLRRPTDIVLVPPHEWRWVRGLPYTAMSLFLGWWGLPWGFIYTPIVLFTNMTGGCDVTAQTRAWLESQTVSGSEAGK
ncbi:MAG TPA: hypothetical protein VGZ47_21985 [Gemmataceae bacterium]|jgi:hypothetical protein|nr:hypothetical protein [Gemmataceae bacterium]